MLTTLTNEGVIGEMEYVFKNIHIQKIRYTAKLANKIYQNYVTITKPNNKSQSKT